MKKKKPNHIHKKKNCICKATYPTWGIEFDSQDRVIGEDKGNGWKPEKKKPKFDWFQYSDTVRVKPNRETILFEKKRLETMECLNHQLSFNLFSCRYRIYRRGINRCLRCGLKRLYEKEKT